VEKILHLGWDNLYFEHRFVELIACDSLGITNRMLSISLFSDSLKTHTGDSRAFCVLEVWVDLLRQELAESYRAGQCRGPLNHFYFMKENRNTLPFTIALS
jgi:hypothetical protein